LRSSITLLIVFALSGCTQIVTAPIAVASKVVTTTFDIAGAAGGAVVNTVRGGSEE
jgi:hypothetical protein